MNINKMVNNPIFYTDFYKFSHMHQYPEGTTKIWCHWTPRKSRQDLPAVVFMGSTYLCEKYLNEEFQTNFFKRPLAEILEEYKYVCSKHLGVKEPYTKHIEELHKVGFLPIKIWAVPEGTCVPIGVPCMVVTNTSPSFFWLPNYLETLMSCVLWKMSQSATSAYQYRRIVDEAAFMASVSGAFLDYQVHDFSMRGMSGIEDVKMSGMGHLTLFSGSDSVPAILEYQKYYNAPEGWGSSIPATEHSVHCAYGKENELETYRHLITKVHPNSALSIVSDTWDLWHVIANVLLPLKKEILEHDGKIVIRPDSGNPVKIVCGDNYYKLECPLLYKSLGNQYHPAAYGVISLLRNIFGTVKDKNLGVLINNVGCIYGEAVTPTMMRQILLDITAKGLSPYNMVFGVGSFTYQYVTRDTSGWAFKACAIQKGAGKPITAISKNPITDRDSNKKSLPGIPLYFHKPGNKGYAVMATHPSQLDECAYKSIFSNGLVSNSGTHANIRERINNNGELYYKPTLI